jgi:hypothetical protein
MQNKYRKPLYQLTPIPTLFAILVFFSTPLKAQETIVTGKILELKKQIPVPFANISYLGTTIGTTSNFDGNFKLASSQIGDTLVISAIGYKPTKYFIEYGKSYHFNVLLEENVVALNEVVVKPGENPAHVLLRKIRKKRKQNDPARFDQYNCTTYTCIYANLKNLDTKLKEKALFRNHPDIFLTCNRKDIRTLSLPIYLSEKLSENRLQPGVPIQSKVIATNKNGIGLLDDSEIEGYTNNMSIEANFYQNYITLMGKSFISPLANNGLAYYKYYLEDSIQTKGQKIYTIRFKPKRKKDLAFTGSMQVIDKTFALKRIEATLPKSANINFLNHLKIEYEFKTINDTITFFSRNRIAAEFNYYKAGSKKRKPPVMEVIKTTDYRNVNITSDSVVKSEPLPVPASEKEKDLLLNQYRVERTDSLENQARNAIQTLNNTWFMKATDKLSRMFINGYYETPWWDFGPYLNFLKRNKVEGNRFTFTGRTNKNLSKNFMFYGHIGYGQRDRKWKYGAGMAYRFNSKLWQTMGLSYSKDMDKIGDLGSIKYIKENRLASGEDNLLAVLIKRRPSDKLSMHEKWEAYYEKEWTKGFSNHLIVKHMKIHSGKFVPFTHKGTFVPDFSLNEVTLNTRISFKEKSSEQYFRYLRLGSKYPIINLQLGLGNYRLNGKTNNFYRFRTTLKHKLHLGLGELKYVAELGYLKGKVPFPLLEIHRGNESFGYSRFKFNLMNQMVYASDCFLSLMPEYHMNGILFNRIPLLRALELREVVSGKMIMGSLRKEHAEVLDLPQELRSLKNPYMELGVGVENILKILRIEAIWNLSKNLQPNTSRFGIRARFQINF